MLRKCESEKKYKEAIMLEPNNTNAHYNLGVLLEQGNRLENTKREKEVWLCIEDYITNEKGKITQEKLAEYVSLETNEHISRQSLKLLLERAAKKADID